MSAAAIKQDRFETPPGMKTPFIVSGIFHVALIVIALVGLPYFKTEPPPMMSAIPIEILPIAELTTTNKPPVEAPPAPEPEKLEKAPEKKPMPPKVEEVKTPEPPKPKKAVEAKPKPKPVTPPPPDEAALEKTKVEPKPEEKKPPEPVEAKEKAEEPDTSQDFTKLLKNLQDSKPQVEETLPESKEAAAPTPSPVAAFSEQLTMSELDALRQQLSRCWSIQAGARYAEELVVEVRLIVTPDRHVQSATIVDQWRYGQDSYFRAAADSAIRAVNSPQCETLNLNPDKFNVWKDMVVTFDPREML